MRWEVQKLGFLSLCGFAALCGFTTQGCMFLVDFEELKEGSGADGGLSTPTGEPEPEPDSGEAGNGGTPPGPAGGNAGEGGTNGGPNNGGGGSGSMQPCSTDGECDDSDPCTTDSCSSGTCRNDEVVCESADTCVMSSCVDGACVEEQLTGVVPDGFEDVLNADELHRIKLVAGAGRFFYALYGTFNGESDLRLGGFDGSETEPLPIQSLAAGLNSQEFEIGSPGGLVVDDTDSLNVYVAARDIRDGATPEFGEVLRIVFDRDLSLTSRSARKQGSEASYRFGSPRLGPEASFVPGVGPFVVWPGRSSGTTPAEGLFFQTGDTVVQIDAPGDAFIPVTYPVAALQAAHTDSAPAAVWMTDVPGGGIEVFAGTAAGEYAQLSQCQDDPAYTSYGLHASLTLEDLWTVSWSKRGEQYATENTIVQCAGSTCEERTGVVAGEECNSGRVNLGFRHLLVEAFENPVDPDYLYQVIVLAAQQDDSTSMVMVVNDAYVGNDTGVEDSQVGRFTFASGAGATAPDWPEVAVLPPDKIAVSWMQQASDGTGAEAHFVRYRICN